MPKLSRAVSSLSVFDDVESALRILALEAMIFDREPVDFGEKGLREDLTSADASRSGFRSEKKKFLRFENIFSASC